MTNRFQELCDSKSGKEYIWSIKTWNHQNRKLLVKFIVESHLRETETFRFRQPINGEKSEGVTKQTKTLYRN